MSKFVSGVYNKPPVVLGKRRPDLLAGFPGCLTTEEARLLRLFQQEQAFTQE